MDLSFASRTERRERDLLNCSGLCVCEDDTELGTLEAEVRIGDPFR